MWLIAWTYSKVRHREGMGMGDFKMMAMIGAFWGLQVSLLAFFLGGRAGVVPGAGVCADRQAGVDRAGLRRLGWKNPVGTVIFRYQLPFGSFSGSDGLDRGVLDPVRPDAGGIWQHGESIPPLLHLTSVAT
ncbi:MAG: A24 family peptidase [Acidobacteriota bacterium]